MSKIINGREKCQKLRVSSKAIDKEKPIISVTKNLIADYNRFTTTLKVSFSLMKITLSSVNFRMTLRIIVVSYFIQYGQVKSRVLVPVDNPGVF